jgi:hypothetical protein
VTTTVWIDGWQQECCGEPLSEGGSVRWTVVQAGRELDAYFPPSSAVAVKYAQERHGPVRDEALLTIEGRVAAIRAVQLRYVQDEPGSRSFRPVAGSARLTRLRTAGGAELRGRGFAGYLVDLDAVSQVT